MHSKLGYVLFFICYTTVRKEKLGVVKIPHNKTRFLKRTVTVWRAQKWLPRISFIQVFNRFLTSLMDRMTHHIFCPPDLCLFSGDVTGSLEINSHRTCQKPVKNLYKTYAGCMATVGRARL